MKTDRYFYSVVSGVMLLLMLVGFRNFFLAGTRPGGGPIPGPIHAEVIVHGVSLAIWVVLFFVQSALVAAGNRRLHMKLGWAAAAVALAVAISGPVVAIGAPRLHPLGHLYGMTYRQFMLPMLTEIAVFTAFVALGIAYRKRPAIHRSMMLLATLSVISGATSRTEAINRLFGGRGWIGLFGPPLVLGATILVFRAFSTRSLDRWYAAGFASLACLYIAAMDLAVRTPWSQFAERLAPG